MIQLNRAGKARLAVAAVVFDRENTARRDAAFAVQKSRRLVVAWAIDQANSRTGVDTINVAAGLQINVDGASPATGTNTWLTRFTESAIVQGNGATLVGNPAYVRRGDVVATKTNIISSPYTPAIESTDSPATDGLSFAQIGTSAATTR